MWKIGERERRGMGDGAGGPVAVVWWRVRGERQIRESERERQI